MFGALCIITENVIHLQKNDTMRTVHYSCVPIRGCNFHCDTDRTYKTLKMLVDTSDLVVVHNVLMNWNCPKLWNILERQNVILNDFPDWSAEQKKSTSDFIFAISGLKTNDQISGDDIVRSDKDLRKFEALRAINEYIKTHSGANYNQIAKHLHEQKVLTPLGKKTWHIPQVQRIMKVLPK
jgi:hypothetical protein